jgi:peptidoglycan hydrolase-like protein with peptidoglycan-binding domain
MKYDRDTYEQELAEARRELHLTVFANAIKSRYPSKKKGQGTAVAEAEAQDEYKGTGDGTFEEGKHQRGADGKFITKGASGPEVRAIGDALGMTNLPNEFDDRMEERVREFQQSNGLLVDGLVGRQTAAAMLEQEDADTAKPGDITDRQMKRLVKQMRRSNAQKRG